MQVPEIKNRLLEYGSSSHICSGGVDQLIYFWRQFLKCMDVGTADSFAGQIVALLGKHIFSHYHASICKIKRFYTHCEDPSISYLHISYLRACLHNTCGPISTSDLLSILFGDNKTELSKCLHNINILGIQNMLILLSSHYLKINWAYVCRSIPGISKIFQNLDIHISQNNEHVNNCSYTNLGSNTPKYSIHLCSYWVLRDCIYVILSIVYRSRNQTLSECVLESYCNLLKDLTYQRTLLLIGPKISNSNKGPLDSLNLQERCCITSAIPLLGVLMQFLSSSNESEVVVNEIISRISSEPLLDSGIYLKDTPLCNYVSKSSVISETSQLSAYLRAPYKFPSYNSCIDMLIKGGEFLFVYPSWNLFGSLKKKIKNLVLGKEIGNLTNKNTNGKQLYMQLEELFPKVVLRLSKDLEYLIIEEVSIETDTNFKVSPDIGKNPNKREFQSIFKRRLKKRKIPVENIVATYIGYPSKPESIPMPNPGSYRPCFCCVQDVFDVTSLFYRTLTIQTKKKCFKLLSIDVQSLCVKQWHAIIIQFIDLKFDQIPNVISKGLIKITKNKKNKASRDSQLNKSEVAVRWYEEVLPRWGAHWNCNSIPVSIHRSSLSGNQYINKGKNESSNTKHSLEKYLRGLSQTLQLDHLDIWFFGSHWINQNTSMHILVNKPKLSTIKSVQNLKGYSIENVCSSESGNSMSNWINFLHYKFYSSYNLQTCSVVDRGIRFGAPNSKLLSDLWSVGIPDSLRTKIWKIALGNDVKVSNELFNILRLQCKFNIEKNGNYSVNTIIFRYALEIQSIFYNKKRKFDIDKKLSPYAERKVEILNSSASLYYPYFFLEICGFAESENSTFKTKENEGLTPLIKTDEYFIDVNNVRIFNRRVKMNVLDSEYINTISPDTVCDSNDTPFINHLNSKPRPSLDFSSLETLSLSMLIQYKEATGVPHELLFQENTDFTRINNVGNPNFTIIKGLLDTISALISFSPNIGFQPCIINYLSIFLMYMDPPNAFKCMLNLINSFDFLFISNPTSFSQGLEDINDCSIGLLSEHPTDYFLSNPPYYNQYLYDDNIWILFSHIFQSFVYSKLPQLYQHLLYTIGINFENIVIPWFRNIFMDTLSLPVVLIVWDNFLLLGMPLLFQTGLSLLKLCEPQLLKCEDTIEALNLLLNNCDYNSFVIKPDSFTATLREMQKICDVTEVTSIISQHRLIEQKRWVLRSQQSVRNYLLSQGYYYTSTPNTPKGR
ncbi:TBC domain-containing protein [Cryptosporidium canis]|nr:TBC domain-containing protein [Cryptosporidium canis]